MGLDLMRELGIQVNARIGKCWRFGKEGVRRVIPLVQAAGTVFLAIRSDQWEGVKSSRAHALSSLSRFLAERTEHVFYPGGRSSTGPGPSTQAEEAATAIDADIGPASQTEPEGERSEPPSILGLSEEHQ